MKTMTRQTITVIGRIGRVLAVSIATGLVLLAFLGPAAAKKKAKFIPYTIVPNVGDPKAPPVTEKMQIHRGGVSAEISYVTAAARRRMMKATLDIDADPFATPSDREPFFHTFLVSLENNSTHSLLLNPATTRIVTNKQQVSYALDYTTLYQEIGRSKGLTMDQINQIVFDRNMTLRPGGKVRKLFVFEHWVGKWDKVVLGLSLEGDGMLELDLSAPFRKYILPGAVAAKP